MKILLALLLTAVVTQSGCAFLGGAATGALVTGAASKSRRSVKWTNWTMISGTKRISRRVYEQRKEQIEKGSIVY